MPLNRRVLKSTAHDLAQTFISTSNFEAGRHVIDHLMLAARSSGERELWIDLLTGIGEPESLAPPPVMSSAGRLARHDLAARGDGTSASEFVRAAKMTVVIEFPETDKNNWLSRLAVRLPGSSRLGEVATLTCTVEIEDDRGRLHTKTVVRERTVP